MKAISQHKRVLGLLFVVSLCSLISVKLVSSLAQNAPQEGKHPWKVKKILGRKLGVKPPDELGPGERVIDDQIPRHLPLKIEFENLDLEPLLTNWGIKVTNTSDKPIYYLELVVALPGVPNSRGQQFMFPLRYGRMDLIDFSEPVRPEDVPLRPGESHVFKTPEDYLPKLKSRHSEIRRVFLFFQEINFGDKTGFTTTGGLPVPNIRKTGGACTDGNRGDPETSLTILQASYSPDTSPQHSFGFLPLIKTSGSASRRTPQSNLCCPGSTCSFSKESKYTCYCGEGRTTAVTGCDDPLGQCADVYQNNDKTCPDGEGGELTCPEFFRGVCAAYCDRDNDQWYSTSCGGLDCDDNDPKITPFSPQCQPSPSPSPSPTFIAGSCSPTLERRCRLTGGCWIRSKCECDENCNTPVLIDTLGDGFRLTDAAHGVRFNFNGGGPEQMAWTEAGSDDAFLVLDRNGNGAIDDGTELFGNLTPQPPSEQANGFLALAEYDKPAAGGDGDGDGVIDGSDAVFAGLRLWRDANHNGVSEAGELHALPSLDVTTLHLDYKESKLADQYGNQFRYRARVGDARGARVGRWAWDVFLSFATG